MSVSVKNITKLYGEQKALNNVSFDIGSGVVGFLGPNGAGKSTMMKIITCYIPQSEGTAKVCGFDTIDNSIEVRKVVGYLPEHNPLYLEMYVREYLEFIAGVYKMNGNKKEAVDKMIELTGLKPESKKKIGALSKGYRQRVGLAQALIHDPKVLILDEPTSGLDPNQLTEIRSLIRQIGKDKTVILSTHIMQEVEAICDRVIIINKGQIVADENTSALRTGKGNQQIIIVEFEGRIDEKELLSLDEIKEINSSGKNSWKIISHPDADARAAVFKWAVANNHTVLSLQKEEQRLEDIFQKLTRK